MAEHEAIHVYRNGKDQIEAIHPISDAEAILRTSRSENVETSLRTLETKVEDHDHRIDTLEGEVDTLQEQMTFVLTDENVEDADWNASDGDGGLPARMRKINPEGSGSFSLNRQANTPIGDNSIAIGTNNIAIGEASYSEGSDNISTGINAHSEGRGFMYDEIVITPIGDCHYQHNFEDDFTNFKTQLTTELDSLDTSIVNDIEVPNGAVLTKDFITFIKVLQMDNTSLETEEELTDDSGAALPEGVAVEGYYIYFSGAFDQSAHSEGYMTLAEGIGAHSEGVLTRAIYTGHAEGHESRAAGYAAHAEGFKTEAEGQGAHSEGVETQALGEGSHAEGLETIASGKGSHTEGRQTTASDTYSHAEGVGTEASGEASHTEGYLTIASGHFSHAEGDMSQAIGNRSHAEGQGTQAMGIGAHAEGDNTIALGTFAHVEGSYSRALGDYSHAEGQNTTVEGLGAHVEGIGTIAPNDAMHVSGTYNDIDIPNIENYAIMVGNGNEEKRSNAYLMDWHGDAWYAGNLEAEDITSNGLLKAEALEISGVSTFTGDVTINGNLIINGESSGEEETETLTIPMPVAGQEGYSLVFEGFDDNNKPILVWKLLDSNVTINKMVWG